MGAFWRDASVWLVQESHGGAAAIGKCMPDVAAKFHAFTSLCDVAAKGGVVTLSSKQLVPKYTDISFLSVVPGRVSRASWTLGDQTTTWWNVHHCEIKRDRPRVDHEHPWEVSTILVLVKDLTATKTSQAQSWTVYDHCSEEMTFLVKDSIATKTSQAQNLAVYDHCSKDITFLGKDLTATKTSQAQNLSVYDHCSKDNDLLVKDLTATKTSKAQSWTVYDHCS